VFLSDRKQAKNNEGRLMTHALPALKRLPLLSELILVVLLAWMLVGWLLPEQQSNHSNAININTTAPHTLPNLNNMLGVTLFGQAPQTVKPIVSAPLPVKAAAIPPLKLKLLGTVVANDHSAAIIAIQAGGKQSAFFIGDQIQPGVTLKSVEANAIVVNHNGRLERISLEQGKQITFMKTLAPVAISSAPATRPTNTRAPAKNINKRINRKHLQHQLQNIPALLSQALAKPHFSNGKINGFSISNIVPGSLYAQAGLKNGDIIMAVNGQRITGAAQAMTIYTQLKSASALDLQLMRASSMQTIHFDIR